MLNGKGARRVTAKRRIVNPTSLFVVWNGVGQRGRMTTSMRFSNGIAQRANRETRCVGIDRLAKKMGQAWPFVSQDHLDRRKRQQQHGEHCDCGRQAEKGDNQHEKPKRSISEAADEPCEAHVIRWRVIKQPLKRN